MVLADRMTKRHPLRCLFFVAAISAAHPALAENLSAGDCAAGAESRTVRITDITDGDSLIIDGGVSLRLIGINALELHAPDERDRALARQASNRLQALLQGQHAVIIPGMETRDSYGRLLAHVRLPDGRDAAHELVREGLALAVAVGANTRCANSLLALEQYARQSRRGIWQSPGSWFSTGPLTGQEQGFHLVSGKIGKVTGRGARTTLHLDNGLQVMLGRHWPEDHLPYTDVPNRLTGSKVQVRGWLDIDQGRQRMTLHHPGNLELISN